MPNTFAIEQNTALLFEAARRAEPTYVCLHCGSERLQQINGYDEHESFEAWECKSCGARECSRDERNYLLEALHAYDDVHGATTPQLAALVEHAEHLHSLLQLKERSNAAVVDHRMRKSQLANEVSFWRALTRVLIVALVMLTAIVVINLK